MFLFTYKITSQIVEVGARLASVTMFLFTYKITSQIVEVGARLASVTMFLFTYKITSQIVEVGARLASVTMFLFTYKITFLSDCRSGCSASECYNVSLYIQNNLQIVEVGARLASVTMFLLTYKITSQIVEVGARLASGSAIVTAHVSRSHRDAMVSRTVRRTTPNLKFQMNMTAQRKVSVLHIIHIHYTLFMNVSIIIRCHQESR